MYIRNFLLHKCELNRNLSQSDYLEIIFRKNNYPVHYLYVLRLQRYAIIIRVVMPIYFKGCVNMNALEDLKYPSRNSALTLF
jgi:hypothetical protein